MVIRMTFAGEGGGLGQIDDGAVLASGTAAPSFPLPLEQDDDAREIVSGVAEMKTDGFRSHDYRAA